VNFATERYAISRPDVTYISGRTTELGGHCWGRKKKLFLLARLRAAENQRGQGNVICGVPLRGGASVASGGRASGIGARNVERKSFAQYEGVNQKGKDGRGK